MQNIRKQLTLFIHQPNGVIEKIRREFNPVQYHLIAAHVTLCREDEIEPMAATIKRLKTISLPKPLQLQFTTAKRFANGKGVFIPTVGHNHQFVALRKEVLGQSELIKEQIPHITLMHPGNATCTDQLFEQIKTYQLPTQLSFKTISLIEQQNGGKWKIVEEFTFCK